MPLVAHTQLPTLEILRQRGDGVLTMDQAIKQDIRELHVGLLNLMPDGAFTSTETQFLARLGNASSIVHIHPHVFTVPGLPRGAQTQAWIDTYYEDFEDLQAQGLDCLIVTGANVGSPQLHDQPFWTPLTEVLAWSYEHVTSTLLSCLSSHAIIQHLYGIQRERLLSKRWGVFKHWASMPSHPLLRGMNTQFDIPHSRWNGLPKHALEETGVQVLVESYSNDVGIATSPDGFKLVFIQGHPEYDTISLLKEYKREVTAWAEGKLEGIPPFPSHYLSHEAKLILGKHIDSITTAVTTGQPLPVFPEDEVRPLIHNTWADSANSLFNNWIGLVYRLTHVQRGVPWMDGIDPDNPLAGLR